MCVRSFGRCVYRRRSNSATAFDHFCFSVWYSSHAAQVFHIFQYRISMQIGFHFGVHVKVWFVFCSYLCPPPHPSPFTFKFNKKSLSVCRIMVAACIVVCLWWGFIFHFRTPQPPPRSLLLVIQKWYLIIDNLTCLVFQLNFFFYIRIFNFLVIPFFDFIFALVWSIANR